ncbi:BON domain-containing protein [Thiohalophilus sp.]|uniref:BON domain-containing protein n=1 Tax=Thiohalophilus sp. TaxID=3028392 RepID=UPI002ACD8740|nr:BON domain-containing protein [Thiohalophilus sp.]MDZ7663273.1 BON domain-containing protein [Thiohalophilus sp.]
MFRLPALLIALLLAIQITACGTLAATGGHSGSSEYGFDSKGTTPSDASIGAAIRRQLIQDPDINAGRVAINTTEGMVTLDGEVSDEATRQRIISLCRKTPGVKQVNARLKLIQD